MFKWIWILVAASATVAVCSLMLAGRLPLGISGEWEWPMIDSPGRWVEAPVAAIVVAVYLAFVWSGAPWVAKGRAWIRRAWVAALVPAGFVVQMALQMPGYGLAKWPMVLFFAGSSGYYTVARNEVRDVREFLAHFDQFQERQGPYHLGTHPPGLILLHYGALRWCEASPRLTRVLRELEPQSVREGFRTAAPAGGIPPADEASLWLVALLTQFASALTVVPLFWLAGRTSGPATAWFATALWPLVPAVTVFCPKSDVLYPLIATTCVALALGGQSAAARWCSRIAAGVVLWIGLFLSLAAATVLPVIVLATVLMEMDAWRKAVLTLSGRLAAMAAGVAIPTTLFWFATDHNLLRTWIDCYHKHAEFYVEMPRSYWPWVGFSLPEFAVACGVPLFVAAIAGTRGRSSALAWAWWATILALDLSGKNLGEVARLWIFLTPFAVPPAAAAFERLGSVRWPVLVLQILLALQTIVFVASVQGFFDPRSLKIPDPKIPGPVNAAFPQSAVAE